MEWYATSEKENEYMSKMFGIILLVMVLLLAGCGKTTVENQYQQISQEEAKIGRAHV